MDPADDSGLSSDDQSVTVIQGPATPIKGVARYAISPLMIASILLGVVGLLMQTRCRLV